MSRLVGRLCIYDWETGKVLCRGLRVLEWEGVELLRPLEADPIKLTYNPDPNDPTLCPECLRRWLVIAKRKKETVA